MSVSISSRLIWDGAAERPLSAVSSAPNLPSSASRRKRKLAECRCSLSSAARSRSFSASRSTRRGRGLSVLFDDDARAKVDEEAAEGDSAAGDASNESSKAVDEEGDEARRVLMDDEADEPWRRSWSSSSLTRCSSSCVCIFFLSRLACAASVRRGPPV